MLRFWVDGRDTLITPVVRGIDDIDETLSYLDKIESFEAARRAAFPWLPTARRE
jgi:hypothetical protein